MLAAVALTAALALQVGAGDPPSDPTARTDLAAAVTQRTDVCQVVRRDGTLPAQAQESSGLARGTAHPNVFWTHNDSGNRPELYGVDGQGRLVARVHLEGASMVDWEDIEAAPCAAGSCLYVADTGDNDAERETVTVYELEEPAPDAERAAVRPFHARYPDGRRDAEALFAVQGELYLVTKGRHGPIRIYRFPRQPNGVATLELVTELAPQPGNDDDRVTGATSSPDGRWIAIRTHALLRFYPADRLLAGETTATRSYDLRGLGQPQGESVALDDAGTVWLSSEAEAGGRPRFARLRCVLD